MALDERARRVIDMLDARFPPVESLGSVAAARAAAKSAPPPLEVEKVDHVEDRSAPALHADGPEVPVRVYRPRGCPARAPAVLYLHGGGWVLCDLDTHDGACRRLANETGCVVVSVDYRLAPEHRFPAAVDDAYAAASWTATNAAALDIDESRLAIAGDSSGGNLAAAVTLLARDRQSIPLAHQLLIYPVIDNSAERNQYPSKSDNAIGFRLTTESMEWYRSHYLVSDTDGDDPSASPIRATDLGGLPPAFIVTAEFDPLRDEGEAYGRALQGAGVAVNVYRAEGMFHGFFNMDTLLPDALHAQRYAFTAVRDALGSE